MHDTCVNLVYSNMKVFSYFIYTCLLMSSESNSDNVEFLKCVGISMRGLVLCKYSFININIKPKKKIYMV